MNTNMTGFRLFSKIFASWCFGRKYSVSIGGVKVPLVILIWIYDVCDNNLEILNDFTKHLKGS